MENTVYVSDNFFSAGETIVKNQDNQEIGYLDLKSAFSSGVSFYGEDKSLLTSGGFKTFSNQWVVSDKNNVVLGVLKTSWFAFSKKYTYTKTNGSSYKVSSPAFSKDFTIHDDRSNEVATFKRTSSFFSSSAYELNNHGNPMSTEELIIVVMGVNAIEKRKQSSAAT